jgi:hypothetical protein
MYALSLDIPPRQLLDEHTSFSRALPIVQSEMPPGS